MTIEVKIIADSIAANAPRLTTMQLKYPRFIHAELMTHRKFSRNASSSRAIPVKKMIQDIIEDTAMPLHWGRNMPGMQAKEENNDLLYHGSVSPLDMVDNRYDGVTREKAWFTARDKAISVAEAFDKAGYHKQIVNRILEPFMHISVIVSSTDFANFYHLRRHPDAQPEIKALADSMFLAQKNSTPTFLVPGQWHLPYITDEDRKTLVAGYDGISGDYVQQFDMVSSEDLIKCSVARCARVSYLTHDGEKPSMEKDLSLYERLVGSVPLHASPAEHQATPDRFDINENMESVWSSPQLSGNFSEGWIQYRKLLDKECVYTYEGI